MADTTKNKTKQNKEEEIQPWRGSQAKENLLDDIITGKVWVGMDPKAIYEMREEYKDYKYENFRNNVKNLFLVVDKMYTDADIALEGYENFLEDLNDNPPPPLPPSRNYPKWGYSEAERLLKIDMDRGLFELFEPEMMWNARDEYLVYPLEVFRNHIYQEQRNRMERPYWKYNEQLGLLGNKIKGKK